MHRATLPIAALVLVALLAWWWLGDPDRGNAPVDAEDALWDAFQPSDVARVQFIDKSEVGTMLARGEEGWTLQLPGSDPVPAVGIQARAVAAALAGLTSVRSIETTAPTEEYGLGISALRIRAILTQGDTRELVIGDEVPIGEGRYVLTGDATIRVAPDAPLAVLLRDPLDLLPPPPDVP